MYMITKNLGDLHFYVAMLVETCQTARRVSRYFLPEYSQPLESSGRGQATSRAGKLLLGILQQAETTAQSPSNWLSLFW